MRVVEISGKIAERIIWVCFALMMVYLFLLSIFSTCMVGVVPGEDSKTFYIEDNFIVHALIIAGVLLIGGKLYHEIDRFLNKLSGKRYLFLAAYAVIGILFIVFTQMYPIADQRELLYIVENMGKGDFSDFYPGGYMDTNPHQKGILLYVYLFYLIFGSRAFLAFQVVNVLWMVLSIWVLGKIAKVLWEEKAGEGLEEKVILTAMLFLPAFFFITYIYGNVPGNLLALVAIWLEIRFLKSGSIWKMIVSVLCIGLAVILKMNCLIMGIGMLLYAVGALRRKKFMFKTVGFCLLLIIAVAYGNKAVDLGMEKGFGVPAAEGVPMNAFIAMGLQDNAMGPGWWNSYTWDTYRDSGYDSELTAQKANKQIKRQIEILTEDPISGVRFFIKKFASGWNNPTYQGLDILVGRDGKNPAFWNDLALTKRGIVLHTYMNLYQSLILAGCILYLWFYRKKLSESTLLLPVIILGGCAFHMLWEMKSSYIMPYFFLMIPLAVIGYQNGFRAVYEYMEAGRTGRRERMAMKKKVFLLCGAAVAVLLLSGISRTTLFEKTIGLNESEESYEELYYQKFQ